MSVENQVQDLIVELAPLTSSHVIVLRYIHGVWTVLVDQGNGMGIVSGSSTDDPVKSLIYCIHKWNERGPENPFIW